MNYLDHDKVVALGLGLAVALGSACDGSEQAPIGQSDVELRLEPAAPSDLVGRNLATGLSLADAINFEQAPLAMSWAPDPTTMSDVQGPVAPFTARSRSYRLRVSARELEKGVELPFSAPGAVIQLALGERVDSAGLRDEAVTLRAADGRTYLGHEAMAAIVGADDMQDTELAFARGTSVLRVHPEIAPGAYHLSVAGLAPSDARDIAVIVLEPESDMVLEAQNSRNAYLAGETLLVDATWVADAGATPAMAWQSGAVASVNGARGELALAPAGLGAMRGQLVLEAAESRPGELWEVTIDAQATRADGVVVRRTVTTAFAYAHPTARLAGRAGVAPSAGPSVDLGFAVDVGSKGRYALTGVLFGSDEQGVMRPAAVAQSASVLEAGEHQLGLSFDRALVDASGLVAPFEVRDLRLLDQTRMGLLHSQDRALALPRL